MRIAFLGTPDFALPSLQMLIDEGHDIVVFTQPDKPKGRKQELTPPPVKVLAQQNGIEVFQPVKISSEEGQKLLKDAAPELMVTAAWGQLLSAANLSVPKYGCINVHGSLLPKYRGAAPIQRAIIDGEKVTGVTTMLTDVGLDSGDILLKKELAIGENETAGELFDRMAVEGARLLKETIDGLIGGSIKPVPQDEALATKCRMIKKEDGKIDFTLSSQRIHDLVRGTDPWPGAFALVDGEVLKIWETRMCDMAAGKPGEVLVANDKQGLFVSTGDGAIEITSLQFPGGKRMSAKDALRGKPLMGKFFS